MWPHLVPPQSPGEGCRHRLRSPGEHSSPPLGAPRDGSLATARAQAALGKRGVCTEGRGNKGSWHADCGVLCECWSGELLAPLPALLAGGQQLVSAPPPGAVTQSLGLWRPLGRSLGRCPGSVLTGRATRGFKSVHSLPHPLPHSINIPVPLLGIISQAIHTCLSLELSLVGIQVSHAVPQCGV